MPKKTYKIGEDIYDIEDSDVAAFLKQAPNAKEVKSFLVGKDTFDLELPDVDAFIKQVPDAKPLYEEPLKKKEQTMPFDGQKFGGKKEEPLLPLTSSTVSPSASKPPKSTIPSASIGVKESEIGFKPDLTIPWDKAPAGSEIIKADKNADYLRVKTAKSPENKPFVDFKTERVFESLPSVTKSVINKDNELKLDFLNFVKDNPESAAKLQAWQGDNTATGQGVKYEVLQGFYNNVLGKYVPHLEELDKAGVGSQLQKAQSFYGDFNKSIDDLKKAQVKLQFYQNNFIESKGYGDIVAQGKQLNNKLKGFNIDAWQADTERLLADIEIKKAETEKYIVDGSVPREYQDEYAQAYGQYESAVNIYNEHNNIPELQDYNNNIQSLKNLDAESAGLLREFEGNSDYKKAKEDYEVALQRFESMKPQAEEFKQQQPLFNDYIQTAKKVSNLVDKIELSNKAFPAIISREETRERVTNLYNNGYMNESTLRNFAGIAESIPKAVNSIGAGIGSTLSALTFGQAGEYNVYDKMADYYDGLNKYNSTVLPTMKSYKELKDGSTKWDFAAIGFQGFQQIGNMAIFATLGRYGKAPMVVTGYMMSRKDRENEAKEAGLTGLSKEAYVSTLSSLEGLSELVMPDSQIFTKEIKQKLLKDAVLAQTKGINWFRKQAFKRIAENTGKEVTEEFIVKIGELMQKVSSNYSNGNVFDVSSYKDVNSWIETAAITAPLTILASSASEIKTPKIELEQARFQAAKNLTKSREVLDDLVSTGNMTTQKADDEYKKIVNYAAIQSVMPVDISPAKAVEVAPLIIENKKLEIVKESGIDEVFKKQINEKIKENIAKAEEILSRPEEPTPKGDTELEVTEPVIEEGKEQDKEQIPTAKEEKDDEFVEIPEDELAALEQEIEEQKVEGNVEENIGQKAYLGTEEGMIKMHDTEKNTVVFETNNQIIDLGQLDLVSGTPIASFSLSKFPQEGVRTEPKTEKEVKAIKVDGKEYEIIGRARDKKGLAVVKLKEKGTGLVRRLKGDKAERILKDLSLQVDSRPAAVKLKTEGKEKPAGKTDKQLKAEEKARKSDERKKAREAFQEKTLEELKQEEAKSEKLIEDFEKQALDEAVKSVKNTALVQVGEKIFQVAKKSDGTFSVSQMREDGKMVGIKDEKSRKEAVEAFSQERSEKENEALANAQKLIEDFKSEEKDRFEAILDKAINALSSKGRAFDATIGLPIFVAKSALQIIKLSYKAGKTLTEAISDGYKYIKDMGYVSVSEFDFKQYVLSQLTGKTKESTKKQIAPEQIEAGRQEVSAIKEGKVETANPIRLFKGLFGKRNPDGTHKSAHPNAKGVFSAVDEKVAERYKGEDGMGTFDIPAGTTMEVIRLAVRNVPMSKFREQETEAINASDAQIVKLITTDAKGAEEQYVIKDPALIEKMQKPEDVKQTKEQENAVQKQTAGQVPVQPETEVSEGVEGGKPKAEPKEVTEESKAEKVKFPDNISKIAKELNLSPQQIQNTYKKYDGSKKIEDITLEDYNKARAEGDKIKLDNSKKAFEALLKEEIAKDKVSPTAQKELAKVKENVDDKALKAASKMMENIDEIREKLLDAGVIKSINCKWG